jgi:hypothetical protein
VKIEEWPSETAARTRIDQLTHGDGPSVDTEYRYRVGAVVVRVSGQLSEAEALTYRDALDLEDSIAG